MEIKAKTDPFEKVVSNPYLSVNDKQERLWSIYKYQKNKATKMSGYYSVKKCNWLFNKYKNAVLKVTT